MPSETATSRRWWQRAERVEERSLSRETLPPVLAPALASAESVNGRTALGLADVFASVRALSDGAVLCPIKCYRDGETGRVPLTGGRGPGLLRAPQPGVTQSALVAQLVAHLALWGEGFLGLVRDGDGQVIQLEVLAPDRVVVKIVNGEPVYTYFSPLNGVFDGLGIADVIHVRGMTGPDGIRGASPVGLCREALGLSASLTTAASALWANGAVPAGILTVPAGVTAEDAIGTLAQAWGARHQGPEARGRVAVLSGDVSFQAVSMPLADAQFIESRRLSTAEIARIFRVPVSIIGGTSGDSLRYSTAESEAQAFVTFGLGPWLRLVEDALSACTDLFPRQSTGCYFDTNGLMRADAATRASIWTQGLAAGWLTISEVRDFESLGPLPPGQEPPDPAAEAFAEKLAGSGITKEVVGG